MACTAHGSEAQPQSILWRHNVAFKCCHQSATCSGTLPRPVLHLHSDQVHCTPVCLELAARLLHACGDEVHIFAERLKHHCLLKGYKQCRSAFFMSSGCQPNFLKYVCTPKLHPFIILRTLQSSRGLYRKEVQRTPAARSCRATLTMVKQRMTTADVAGEVACLRQRGVLGMRVANLYDLNSKVLSAYTQIQQ